MSYMQTADELRKEVETLVNALEAGWSVPPVDIAKQIGHIVNLAVRCAPRAVQGTVRKNIVSKAVEKYCRVTMTRETDERTGREYNKIHIEPRS